LIIIFKGGRSERDDFVTIVNVGSHTHPNNAFCCVFATFHKQLQQKQKMAIITPH
jgi:hypothetical protein